MRYQPDPSRVNYIVDDNNNWDGGGSGGGGGGVCVREPRSLALRTVTSTDVPSPEVSPIRLLGGVSVGGLHNAAPTPRTAAHVDQHYSSDDDDDDDDDEGETSPLRR